MHLIHSPKVTLAITVIVVTALGKRAVSANHFVDLGILHTIARYSEWHAKEEKLVEMITQRLEILATARKLALSYLRLRTNIIKFKSDSTSRNLEMLGRVYNFLTVKLWQVSRHLKLKKLAAFSLDNRNIFINISKILELSKMKVEAEYSISSLSKKDNWVGGQDMFFTSSGWINLQEIYLFSPSNLVKGLEIDTMAGGKLTETQCAEIGIFALLQKRYYIAVEWLEVAILLSRLKLNFTFRSFLSLVIQEHNRAGQHAKDRVPDTLINHYRSPITMNQSSEDRVPLRNLYFFERNKVARYEVAVKEEQFMKLCMGYKYQSPQQQVHLKCYYEKHRDSYFIISPLKVEQLSGSPPLYQFYDVLGNGFIENLKSTFGKYVKTGVSVGHSRSDIKAKCGTSAGIGLDPYHTPQKFYRISEMISGLKLLISPLHDQYVEYTYGRMYQFHLDHSYNKPELLVDYAENGDRFATMIYYLEIPDFGGYTPFMSAGVYAYPVKGSAILWFNMYQNGTLRWDVDHGACPVIHRNKIIMTHFFRYNTNWNTEKCSPIK